MHKNNKHYHSSNAYEIDFFQSFVNNDDIDDGIYLFLQGITNKLML